MKSIEKEALKKTIAAIDEIKEYDEKIEEFNQLKNQIYIRKGFGLVKLLQQQVNKDIKKCTSRRHKYVLLTIKQLIAITRIDSSLYCPYEPDTCHFRRLIKNLIRDFNDVTLVPTDFMAEHKEIYTIYTCMVNLELEFRKE